MSVCFVYSAGAASDTVHQVSAALAGVRCRTWFARWRPWEHHSLWWGRRRWVPSCSVL